MSDRSARSRPCASESDFKTLQIPHDCPDEGNIHLAHPGISDSYAADLLEFELRPRTIDELAEIGVRSNAKAVQDLYPDMPVVSKGWPEFAAHFGGDGLGHVNIGLGRVPALQIFNDATVKWREIVR